MNRSPILPDEGGREASGAEPRRTAGPDPVDLVSAALPPAGRSPGGPPSDPEPPGAGPSGSTPATGAGAPVAIPGELAEQVAQIGHAIDTGDWTIAAALTLRLRRHTARSFGAEHPYTLEALALEAFAAHKSGAHPAATLTCLELARIRHRRGDRRAREELMRAVAAWRLIDDLPHVIEHARALLAVWARFAERDGGFPEDIELVRGVSRRVQALATRSVANRAGTGAA